MIENAAYGSRMKTKQVTPSDYLVAENKSDCFRQRKQRKLPLMSA